MKKPNPDAIRREEEQAAKARYLARPDDGACCVCGQPRAPESGLFCQECIEMSRARSRAILAFAARQAEERRAREAQWARVDAPA